MFPLHRPPPAAGHPGALRIIRRPSLWCASCRADRSHAEKAIPPEILHNLERTTAWTKPLWRQYSATSARSARVTSGRRSSIPTAAVNEIIASKFPVSLELGCWSLLIAVGLGLPLGIIAAARQNTFLDYLCSAFGMHWNMRASFL